jgi:hypothetical protein
MTEYGTDLPLALFLAIAVCGFLVTEGLLKWQEAWAKPALTVYGTIFIWYPGDFLMAGMAGYRMFTDAAINISLLQVSACLLLIRCFIPSAVARFTRGLDATLAPVSLSSAWMKAILIAAIVLWLVLLAAALARLQQHRNFEEMWPAIFWPPLYQYKVSMFGHSGRGTGASFIWAAMGYIQRLDYAVFGVLAVLGRGKIRLIALMMMALSWPYIFFDRMRNVMLAVLLPGVAAFWVSSSRSIVVKIAVSLLLLLALDYWFKVVLVYRLKADMAAFASVHSIAGLRHHGLDMLKELCYVNTFLSDGTYRPNLGQRYFAEVVNFVPRTLWPGKPDIGLDYAIARGFGANNRLGVHATIATGLIGQGVVNFGRIAGPVCVAGLCACWIGFLSRLWLQRQSVLRLLLFMLGLGVTFNCGRDITLLVLFPFVFAYIIVRVWERYERRHALPRIGCNSRLATLENAVE